MVTISSKTPPGAYLPAQAGLSGQVCNYFYRSESKRIISLSAFHPFFLQQSNAFHVIPYTIPEVTTIPSGTSHLSTLFCRFRRQPD